MARPMPFLVGERVVYFSRKDVAEGRLTASATGKTEADRG